MRFMVMLSMALSLLLAGCAGAPLHGDSKQAGSMVDYLYPDATEAPHLEISMTYLRPPVRVGLAFVPGTGREEGLTETEKARLLERVKSAFAQYSFIGSLEVIPSNYVRPKGGFTNVDQLARLFNVELVVLMSYDQMQFNERNGLSVLYWTLAGALLIEGEQYDVQTMLDASVFDVRSRKLLFRAPGSSRVKGSASLAGFSGTSRAARGDGFQKALDDLIPTL